MAGDVTKEFDACIKAATAVGEKPGHAKIMCTADMNDIGASHFAAGVKHQDAAVKAANRTADPVGAFIKNAPGR